MYRVKGLLSAETTEYQEDVLEYTPHQLELTVLAGKKAEGALFLHAQSGNRIYCFLYSTHYRMQPQASFAKGDEIYVTWQFDASGLSPGCVINGQVIVLSDIGQAQVPFTVTVSDSYEDEKLGSIRNLFHFTNLASGNWRGAMELFYSDRMEKLLTGHDERLIPLYRSLSAVKDNARNLDEFLICLNKKRRATFKVDDDVLLLPQVYEPQQQLIAVRRKGWGYSRLTVSVEGDYLTCEKNVLTEEDFTDNVCHISVILLPTDGYEHREKVIIDTDSPTGRMCVELVRIGKTKKDNPKEKEQKEKKRQTALLMRAYLDYSTGRGDEKEALGRAEKCIEKINSTDGRNLTGRLYQTHLLITMGRIQEAGWIFSHVERVIEKEIVTPAQQAYFWYLEAQLSKAAGGDYQKKRGACVRRLRDLLANDHQDAVVTSLYLRLLEPGQITPVKMLSLYEECYYSGCESPILLREAFRVVADNPAYLSGLGDFEVAMLQFALRYELLTATLENRIIDLIKREKRATRALLSFLRRVYQGYQEDDLLQAVCSLLIRTGKCDQDALFWFRKAVDKQLRITMLYESYMAARGLSELSLPPKYVLMYFAYQCNLEKSLRAHLYRIVIEHHTRLGALIDTYDPQIRDFARQCLEAEEYSVDLGYCYRFLFKNKEEIEKAAPYLPAIGFLHQIRIPDPKMKKLIVAQRGLAREMVYPIKDGVALARIYTDEHYLLLEDEEGNRHVADKSLKAERLVPLEPIRRFLLESDSPDTGLSLFRISGSPDDFMKRTEQWPLYLEAARDIRLSLSLRLSILERLLKVLYEREENATLMSLLSEYPIEGSDENKRGQIIAYHIWLEQDETALSLLWDYGFEGVPPKSLIRLIRRGLEHLTEADPKWIALMYYTYRQGKFTQELLDYLCRYYEGGITQMTQIFKDAVSFEVDALPLAERILTAATFTKAFLPQWDTIFDYYVARGGNRDMKKRFLQDLCFRCFVGGEVMSEESEKHLLAALTSEEDMPPLCAITWLYLASEKAEELTEREKKLAVTLIMQRIRKGGYLPFFEAFTPLLPSLLPYAGRTWLVYRSGPGRRVRVSFLGGRTGEETYTMRCLEELCPGYYARDFLMFYGESIHYYIQEESGDQMVLTQSGQLERSEALPGDEGGRFEQLYDMIMSRHLGDDKTATTLAEEYMREDKLISLLFG